MCKHGSPPPAPPTTNPRRRMAINTPAGGLVSPPSHPWTDAITCKDTSPPPRTHPLPRLPPLAGPIKGYLRPPQPRRDHAPCSQVTRDSPSNPAHHARPLVSALPPRCVHPPRSSTAVFATLPASQGTYLVSVACHCCTGTVVYRSQRVVQVDERALSGECGQSATRAMVDTPTLTGTCIS
jgi:hypothetical protein